MNKKSNTYKIFYKDSNNGRYKKKKKRLEKGPGTVAYNRST